MTYEAIGHTTETFVELLSDTADHPELPVSPDEVQLASPADVGPNDITRIGIYPYRVRKDGSVGSMNTTQLDDSARRDPPLAVAIDYLVTAYPREDEDIVSASTGQQQALGLALQTINDRGVIEPENEWSIDQDTRLTISLRESSQEALTSLWARFDATYQPSVSVEASPVMIRSLNETAFARIAERDVDVNRENE
jgi:hypothetical protein